MGRLSKYFAFPYEELNGMSFKMMVDTLSLVVNTKSMADGLNAIRAHLEAGIPMGQEIYSEKEKLEDPTKERTGLLWFPAEKKGPFALICAGGGYGGVASITEGFPVAKRLNELGITAFVLHYRVGMKGAAKKAGKDLRRALKFILEQKEKFNVEEEYAAFGFSAGGHLVSELGTDNEGYKIYGLPKPQMLGLCYAVVSFSPEGKLGPMIDFMLEDADDREEKKKYYTPIEHLSRDYPKTFIWHTVEDEMVPFDQNAKEIHIRLENLGVPCRLKIVQHGMHGLGLGEGSEAEGWVEEAVAFWKEQE